MAQEDRDRASLLYHASLRKVQNSGRIAAQPGRKGGKVDEVEKHIRALGDKDGRVRLRATIALGEIGDPRAVEPLTRALGDEDEDVRQSAGKALNKIQKK